jgi:hypothetical protein
MDKAESKSESKEYEIDDLCVIHNKNRKVIQTEKYRYLRTYDASLLYQIGNVTITTSSYIKRI